MTSPYKIPTYFLWIPHPWLTARATQKKEKCSCSFLLILIGKVIGSQAIYIYICNGNLTRISTEIDFTRLFLIEKYRMLLTQTHLASKKGFFMCFSKSFLACSRTYRSENGDGLTLRIERLPKCNSGTCTTVIYIKIS